MTTMECEQPMSRTYQYRKVMKPLLERKRRARINRCLDELKELMVGALQAEGENVAKLEKADVLELTVKYLRKLKMQNRLGAVDLPGATYVPSPSSVDRFKAGFTQCATEVSKCLNALPGVDVALGTRLMTHLGHCVNQLDQSAPPKCPDTPPLSPPVSPADFHHHQRQFVQRSGVSPALYGQTFVTVPQVHTHQQHMTSSSFLLTPVSAVEDEAPPVAPAVAEKVWRPW